MSDAAHLTSIDAVAEFAGAVREFRDDASATLLALDQQVNRALQWLEHDAPAMWRQRIRQQYDEVARARSSWDNCRMRVVAGHEPACLEERKAYRLAQQRLEAAQEKLNVVRAWAIKARREADEYRGRVGRLKQALDGDVPRTLALLERTHAALTAYVDRPEQAPEPPASEGNA